MDQQPKPTHVAIIPSPGMGHVIPLVQLAKRLLEAHGVTSTIVVTTDGAPSEAMKSVMASLPSSIGHVFLQVSLDDIDVSSAKMETLITLTVARSLPALRQTLASLPSLSALVLDLFATDAIDLALELGLLCHVFFPSTASALSLFLHLPKLDAEVSVEYRELDAVEIPGCIPIPGSELLDPAQDRKNDAYKWTLYNAKRYGLADGVMVNSFKELEPGAVDALLSPGEGKPRVFPVGPLVNLGGGGAATDESGCLGWLDAQPHGSVLFVSFGSGGTLGSAQIKELALGLEESGQRFLWVVRRPNDAAANATYFTVNSGDGAAAAAFDFLPEGFLGRTEGRGMVVKSWAPQAEILAHGATGGFLTHCGWNSTLESVANGVPLVAWPLYAEQKMNAFFLSRDTKVALVVERSSETGLVERREVARVVKALIEGEEGKQLRSRMMDLKEAAAKALSQDGDSSRAIAEVVHQWKNPRAN